jgi:hypothetical protein
MINLSDTQTQAILNILDGYTKPSFDDYLKTSKSLGKEVVKKINIKGLTKKPQEGWIYPLYIINGSEILELPVGYALHYFGDGIVSLHDAAVYLYKEIYNGSNEARDWIKGNA